MGRVTLEWELGDGSMDWFENFITSGAYLAHLAAICYALGLITRDQIVLRILIFLGTLFYIAYYYFVPSIPLWDAIGWSMPYSVFATFTS